MVEHLPQQENRVVLSTTVKDPWGLPAPEVHHQYHEHDRKAAIESLGKIRMLFEAAGAKKIEVPEDIHTDITGRYTWHLMGAARMGNDPATSVVNRDCQAHDVPNLFIADGSTFCTSAGLNPTLTIQALALRTADHLIKLSKEARL